MRVPLPHSKRRARIEIIPLIDIVFFLLATFVMVSMSMVKNQGVAVRLPAAATGAPQETKKYNVISVTRPGEIYFNKDKITLQELPQRLKKLKETEAEPNVFINGDEQALFGDAVSVLDEVRKLGIKKVSLQTRSKEEKPL